MTFDFTVSALYCLPSQPGPSPLIDLSFFSVDPGLHQPATVAPSVRGLSEDGSLCRPMLILRVREIGGANAVSTSHRESPRFFSNSGT